ncbi:hypothetical protein ACW0JT_05800 [Arthrobacter sp. SA17]
MFISHSFKFDAAQGAVGMVRVIDVIEALFYVRLMDSSPGEGLEG